MQCLYLSSYSSDKPQAVRSGQARTSLITHRYPTNYAHRSPVGLLCIMMTEIYRYREYYCTATDEVKPRAKGSTKSLNIYV